MDVQNSKYSRRTVAGRLKTASVLALILIMALIFPLLSCQKEKKAEPERLALSGNNRNPQSL